MNSVDMLIKNSIFRQGASHIKKNLVCQDCATTAVTDDGTVILALSDGHGSERYFRSDDGSRIAVEVAVGAAKEFLSHFNPGMMLGADDSASYIRAGVPYDALPDGPGMLPSPEMARLFGHFARAIILRWHRAIISHWNENPVDFGKLSPAINRYYIEDGRLDESKIPKAYGCTLMLAVRAAGFWFAMHIGDGKIIAFRVDGTAWEPVPWDKACFTTTTTSLCELDEKRTRLAYGTDMDDVAALFLGSDGMDDSFPDIAGLESTYGINFIRRMVVSGLDLNENSYLERLLDYISHNFSGDDMSVAYWVDSESLSGMIPGILKAEVGRLVRMIADCDTRIERIHRDILRNDESLERIGKDFAKLKEGRSLLENIIAYIRSLSEDFGIPNEKLKTACRETVPAIQGKENDLIREKTRLEVMAGVLRKDLAAVEAERTSHETSIAKFKALLDETQCYIPQ